MFVRAYINVYQPLHVTAMSLKKEKNIITLKDVIVVIFRRTKLFMSHTAKAFMHNKVQNLEKKLFK